jgi:hypothetical protein
LSETQVVTRDFSKKRVRVKFTVDDEEFLCRKSLPLGKLQDFVSQVKNTTTDEQNALERIDDLMRVILTKDSYHRFHDRFLPGDEVDVDDEDFEPIDHEQVLDIMRYIIEQFTKRPTKPSSSSSTGLVTDDGGSSSTVGAPPAESTHTTSPSTDSST